MKPAEVTIPGHCPISAAFLLPVPRELLATPLDYIAAEHARQRCVCAYLKQMAAAQTTSRADAMAVIAFIKIDLKQHHEDEDHDLFPALRRRAHAEDGLGPVLHRLSADHDVIDPLAKTITTALTRQLGDSADVAGAISIGESARKAMRAYADTMLQHLSIENSIVLVIARKRLSLGDLATMAHNMIARRGAQAHV